MNFLSMDINIAYSMINMKLRDFYSSLDDMCDDMDISKSDILEHFEKNGFIYNENTNQFIQK
ncbi:MULTISPECIES: DUF4250 domain-containing protein [Fusobacterium]|uniref:DUF4250 domain-containing protein n=1 Tax=Fusobacterium TaxID=848 RepID=UPI001F24FC68|nr:MULTISPECIES: DUF4250 domain-containing protein [Fusobacterium]MDY2980020.1 DUF4250 domain-containing protein [Fusobacterium sp.]